MIWVRWVEEVELDIVGLRGENTLFKLQTYRLHTKNNRSYCMLNGKHVGLPSDEKHGDTVDHLSLFSFSLHAPKASPTDTPLNPAAVSAGIQV